MSIDRKEELVSKLKEVAELLREQGLGSEIRISTSTNDGYPGDSLTLRAGYWESSTASCNPHFYGSHETIYDEDYDIQDRWAASDANC